MRKKIFGEYTDMKGSLACISIIGFRKKMTKQQYQSELQMCRLNWALQSIHAPKRTFSHGMIHIVIALNKKVI